MNLLITINAATLITILGLSYKIMRFINRIEFRVELMWEDYEYRVNGKERRVPLK